MIDVKKLITGFLILAVAAVCSGLIFSLVNFAQSPTTAQQVTIGGDAAANNANAFLPTQNEVQEVAAALAPELSSSTMIVSSTDPNNLTDDVATAFVNGIVAANPNGPTGTDANGNPTLNAPAINALALNIADNTTTKNLSIPNWNIEADSIPVTTEATSSPTALASYGNAVNGIMDAHFNNNTQVQSILNDQSGDTDSNSLAYMEDQAQNALQDISSLKVPAPAVAYQKSLITDLVYEKNLLQLNTIAQTDPVKASLLFQQEDNRFYYAQMNFLTEAQSLANESVSLNQTSSTINGMFISALNNFFGVREAQAQTDPTADSELAVISADLTETLPYQNANQTLDLTAEAHQVASSASLFALISSIHVQNMGQKLEELLKNTLLQILKNTLIAIIQQKVLTWIQGSGAPRFITNWGTQLVNAAQTSALNAINAQMSCGTYPSFIGQEKITLNAFYKPGNNSCANQFAAALGSNSFQQFYNNFANGGFIAFGASTLPSGNPYGSLFFNAQTVSFAYSNQQAASQIQTQTSQGLKGDQVCSDGSDPTNGQHTMCESTMGNTNGDDYELGTEQTTCSAGFAPVVYDNNGLCANGAQPEVTTPAAATGFAFQGAIGATPQQVSAANDIVGVLNAVMNSLLTSLASTAVNAAGQFVNQSLSSLNASNITAAASSTPPAAPPLTCNPASQTIPSPTAGTGNFNSTSTPDTTNDFPTSFSAMGGTVDVNGNPPTYYWSDSNGATSTGAFFNDIFSHPGTYTVTLSDSASDTPSLCTVTVEP